jgi:polysaccharide deacetylase family protein (PEP-CTERM system associated)
MKAIMTVDVEEWFHIPLGVDNALDFEKWDGAVQRVQHIMPRMFDLFEKNNVKATFFFLGWIAEKHPALVREAMNRGHGIATHGYAHKMIYNQTPDQFELDLYKSKSIIENVAGMAVKGYRAPGFSITPQTGWAFEILAENGIIYDSSIFPGKRFYGHFEEFDKKPVIVETGKGKIIEFPQSIVDWRFFEFSCFGGGYFRLFPGFVFLQMSRYIAKKNRPLIMYIHPRDLDIHQPVINFPFLKKVRHYINISKSEKKLDDITSSISFTSFEDVMSDSKFINSLNNFKLT